MGKHHLSVMGEVYGKMLKKVMYVIQFIVNATCSRKAPSIDLDQSNLA
jgi:hypothetical protein